MELITAVLFMSSLGVNFYLLAVIRQLKQRNPNIIGKDEFIAELGRGMPLISVRRINPDDIMYRSPKGRL